MRCQDCIRRFGCLHVTPFSVFYWALVFFPKRRRSFHLTGIVRRKILCDDEGKNLLRASRLSFLYPWDFKGISEPVNHKFQTCHLGLSVSMLSLSVSTLSAVRFYAVIIVQSSKNRIPTFSAVSQMSIKCCEIRKIWWGYWGQNSRKSKCGEKVGGENPIYELKF